MLDCDRYNQCFSVSMYCENCFYVGAFRQRVKIRHLLRSICLPPGSLTDHVRSINVYFTKWS